MSDTIDESWSTHVTAICYLQSKRKVTYHDLEEVAEANDEPFPPEDEAEALYLARLLVAAIIEEEVSSIGTVSWEHFDFE